MICLSMNMILIHKVYVGAEIPRNGQFDDPNLHCNGHMAVKMREVSEVRNRLQIQRLFQIREPF
jgi:hypothetical protein